MIRTASVGASLLRMAEKRARERANHGARRMGLVALAAMLGFGGLVFASVGVLELLAPALGPGTAALVVAAGWIVAALLALVWAVLEHRRPEPPILPENAADMALAAVRADFGANSPLVTLVALGVGLLASQRR